MGTGTIILIAILVVFAVLWIFTGRSGAMFQQDRSSPAAPAGASYAIPISIAALAVAIVAAAFIMRPQQPIGRVPADINVRVKSMPPPHNPSVVDNILNETRKPTPYPIAP